MAAVYFLQLRHICHLTACNFSSGGKSARHSLFRPQEGAGYWLSFIIQRVSGQGLCFISFHNADSSFGERPHAEMNKRLNYNRTFRSTDTHALMQTSLQRLEFVQKRIDLSLVRCDRWSYILLCHCKYWHKRQHC